MHIKKALLLVVLFLFISLSASFHEAKALDGSNSPPFFLRLQFQIFSIDLKTETVYTSNYEFLLKARDSDVSNFSAVILKPNLDEAVLHLSGNETGTSQIYDYLKIGEPKPLEVNRWFLTRKLYWPLLGSPFDRFELSFLMAVNMSTRLELNDTWFVMPVSMQGDWEYEEHPLVIKLAGLPGNQTLVAHGLNPDKFYRQNGDSMTDFYLITETFSFSSVQSLRIAIAYSFPSISILIVAAFSVYRFNRLRRRDFLTLYLSAGLFAFTFLVSFYEYAPSMIQTWQEILLYVDFIFVSVLAIVAVLLKSEEYSKNNNGVQATQPTVKMEPSGKSDDQSQSINLLLAEISARENSTLVISTVAASASLAILAIAAHEGYTSRPELTWIALLFSIVGFLYRDMTILSVERLDYITLRKHLGLLERRLNYTQKFFILARMYFVRLLLVIPMATWSLVLNPLEFIVPAIILTCVSGFFTVIEYSVRYRLVTNHRSAGESKIELPADYADSVKQGREGLSLARDVARRDHYSNDEIAFIDRKLASTS